MAEYNGKVNAPEFPDGFEWLNTGRPLTLKELRGKVVLVDFWTYCCINCMHIIPDLKRLEKKYAKELIVIGVHSAKFDTERESQNIRQAILRYEIEHPVVNDPHMQIWEIYGARAWPTLFLIDPLGKMIGHYSGEGIFDPFDRLIAKVIAEFDARGLIDRKPLPLNLERSSSPKTLLSFPGKVLADSGSDRLFIADSNHNRMVITSLSDGTVQEVVGHGAIGLEDGPFETASFNHPQGMALDGENLYVADTENHAIRKVDFTSRTVVTLAGTGKQAPFRSTGGIGTKADLSSPWDLGLVGKRLYIAMAGTHQLWVMDLFSQRVEPYAGSGREARIDGPLESAALAQPSGITTDGKKLYFADSEISSIRAADLPPGNQVETIVGEDLFEFGDVDGVGPSVRLQHPLGVTFHEGVLYVADTYNNKIKRVFPTTQAAETFLGTGEAGFRDGTDPLFDEPGGLTVAGNLLYIADTNNHVIRVADLKTQEVRTLELKNVEKLASAPKPAGFSGEMIELAPQIIRAGKGTLTVQLKLPAGYKFNPGAPSKVVITSENPQVQFSGGSHSLVTSNPKFPLEIPVQLKEGSGKITVGMTLYYCQTRQEALCYFKEVRLVAPIQVGSTSANSEIQIGYRFRE